MEVNVTPLGVCAGVISLISLVVDSLLLLALARFGRFPSSGSPSVAREADRVIRLFPNVEVCAGSEGVTDN